MFSVSLVEDGLKGCAFVLFAMLLNVQKIEGCSSEVEVFIIMYCVESAHLGRLYTLPLPLTLNLSVDSDF